MNMKPAKVKFTAHAKRRIHQRGLDHRTISSVMHRLPYEDGTHYYHPEGTNMRIVFVDEMRMRTVITAMERRRA